jgi:ABC-type proline/glycine betaine transport system substrate-binding protein
MHANDETPEAAARHLLAAHPELLAQWLDEAVAARVNAALSD